MSEIIIFNFKDPRVQRGNFRQQVSEIFFESSTKKTFQDQKEREAFEWKYLGFYLSHYPEFAWIALKDQQVLGYAVGMPFTQDPTLYTIQPHLKIFEEHFKNFPAHLHINCHENSRGQGIGKMLVQMLLEQMRKEGVPGLHIMTGPDSENRHFYKKLNFNFELIIDGILLMGVEL